MRRRVVTPERPPTALQLRQAAEVVARYARTVEPLDRRPVAEMVAAEMRAAAARP